MPAKLESPYSFRERILVTGQGGAGKTQALLSIVGAAAPCGGAAEYGKGFNRVAVHGPSCCGGVGK